MRHIGYIAVGAGVFCALSATVVVVELLMKWAWEFYQEQYFIEVNRAIAVGLLLGFFWFIACLSG